MLLSIGHGQRLYWAADIPPGAAQAPAACDPDAVPVALAIPGLEDAMPTTDLLAAAAPTSEGEPFGYLFLDAATIPADDRAAALDALAAAMMEDAAPSADGPIPAIITYFGQFIDHDITANTNTEHPEANLEIGTAVITPSPRVAVVEALRNMRKGSLQLDSLYGDGPIDTPAARRAMAALRDGDRMRLGPVDLLDGTVIAPHRPPLPADQDGAVLADLPRVGDIVGLGRPYETPDELPTGLQPQPGAGDRWTRKAFIGDSRNDENLIVAQLHTAMLRFHNAVVAEGHGFDDARRLVTWHYQWLVVNEYLPRICAGDVLRTVIDGDAPLYRHFVESLGGIAGDALPLPFEFSAAAFRFGHSMVRAKYDYNRNFGRESSLATFGQLFQFTGNDPNNPVGFGFAHVPDNWIIEWDRLVGTADPTRNARRIDTHIAPPLGAMANESTQFGGLFQRLAARNLRRGHVLNLPSAQALIASIEKAGLGAIAPLTRDELVSGPTGQAIEAGGFAEATPLWFYVLKEAEVQSDGALLGELGSRIVAETLVGLVVNDRQSFWNAPGGWDPDRGAKPGGVRVDSLLALLRAAGVA